MGRPHESQSVTTVRAAVLAVNGIDVTPTAAISAASPQAADELDAAWHRLALRCSLYSADGSFLVLPPGSGGSSIGWVAVRDPIGSGLPSRVSAATDSPELVALSVDGKRLCAVTVEDNDYWIVMRTFD